MQRLGVNIDHVATIRNARGTPWPDPIRAAQLAEQSGADGITAICARIAATSRTAISTG